MEMKDERDAQANTLKGEHGRADKQRKVVRVKHGDVR